MKIDGAKLGLILILIISITGFFLYSFIQTQKKCDLHHGCIGTWVGCVSEESLLSKLDVGFIPYFDCIGCPGCGCVMDNSTIQCKPYDPFDEPHPYRVKVRGGEIIVTPIERVRKICQDYCEEYPQLYRNLIANGLHCWESPLNVSCAPATYP